MTTTLENPAVTPSFPVFYDKSGKRLHRTVIATLTLIFAAGVLLAYLAPAALAPTAPTPPTGPAAGRASSWAISTTCRSSAKRTAC